MVAQAESFLLSVVVLAYNEEENLSTQVEACARWFERLEGQPPEIWPAKFNNIGEDVGVGEVVIVDDGSTDGTSRVAREAADAFPFVRVVRHRTNLGMGAAVRSGYQAARGRYVTQLPADCQISPFTLEALIPCLDRVDLVLSVYRRRGDGLKRTVMSRSFQLLVRSLYGIDPQFTGTMVLNKSLLSSCAFRSRTFFANLELPFRLISAGVPYEVVEIEPVPRRSGTSKVANPLRILEVVSELVDIRIRDWR